MWTRWRLPKLDLWIAPCFRRPKFRAVQKRALTGTSSYIEGTGGQRGPPPGEVSLSGAFVYCAQNEE